MLRWPDPERVLAQVSRWASELHACRPSLQAVGVSGSYGRGTAGVGSDLELVLIDATAAGPQNQRLLHWPLDQLPLSCDAIVMIQAEFDQLMASGSRMAQELQRDLRWM
ncbi:nucleotidyltransferase domain-containing protein [Synechococcus sp. CBW1107]|uniref:nucleotidyltransferase domain-containing protein n=1 Tax=Synechococcus sp. CBW1107 TaxID=2789857 RepID=UPI002AD3B1C8|nr:nucleotidyltransferase domain-containing protein [Synechococcus sp. CBW1107]